MIDINDLYHSQNGGSQPFDLSMDGMKIAGDLIRTDEGIMMILDLLETEHSAPCVRCEKDLILPITLLKPSEWLFYDKKPIDLDDENEWMRIDKSKWRLDPRDMIRQEIIMNSHSNPHCDPPCIEFQGPDQGVKALAGLKDMLTSDPNRKP